MSPASSPDVDVDLGLRRSRRRRWPRRPARSTRAASRGTPAHARCRVRTGPRATGGAPCPAESPGRAPPGQLLERIVDRVSNSSAGTVTYSLTLLPSSSSTVLCIRGKECIQGPSWAEHPSFRMRRGLRCRRGRRHRRHTYRLPRAPRREHRLLRPLCGNARRAPSGGAGREPGGVDQRPDQAVRARADRDRDARRGTSASAARSATSARGRVTRGCRRDVRTREQRSVPCSGRSTTDHPSATGPYVVDPDGHNLEISYGQEVGRRRRQRPRAKLRDDAESVAGRAARTPRVMADLESSPSPLPLPVGVALLEERGAGLVASSKRAQPRGVVLLGAVRLLERQVLDAVHRLLGEPQRDRALRRERRRQLAGGRHAARRAARRRARRRGGAAPSPGTCSPVKNISRALCRPTSSERCALAPSSPTLISVVPNVALSAASEDVAARGEREPGAERRPVDGADHRHRAVGDRPHRVARQPGGIGDEGRGRFPVPAARRCGGRRRP